jgi:NADPH:quinone reductase-like Zn-dependent oxidoreductase
MAIPVTQTMTYRSVVITRRGTPTGLQILAKDYRAPLGGEARIRVLATAVHQDDVAAWIGNRPFLPKASRKNNRSNSTLLVRG